MSMEKLEQWFKGRPIWVQIASKYLIEKEFLTELDYKELYECCINEAKEQELHTPVIPIERILSHHKENANEDIVRISSIGKIKGINQLSPREPLNFSDNLSVIYGLNGSGKSGYVRILQHITGKPKLDLIPNIYKDISKEEQRCVIEYKKGESLIPIPKEWKYNEDYIGDLASTNIFDSNVALSYVEEKGNEVTYEPGPLIFFSKLIKVCDKISSTIKEEIDRFEGLNLKPKYPSEYEGTSEAKWYRELTENISEETIDQRCSWQDEDQKNLSDLQKKISGRDHKKEAKRFRDQNENLRNLIKQARSIYRSLKDEVFEKSNTLKEKSTKLKIDAIKSANHICEEIARLDGVGTESWKNLWSYAETYSVQEAYKDQSFPVIISENAQCVLCHQKLDEEAKERFKSFDEFIKGKAQSKVKEVEKELNKLRSDIQDIPDEEKINLFLNASGLSSTNNDSIKELFNGLRKRKVLIHSDELQSINDIDVIEVKEWVENSEITIENRKKQAQEYEKFAKESNRDKALKDRDGLKMKEWLHENSEAIKKEVKRLKHISIFNKAKQLVDTTLISRKKGELSEELITDQLVNRFNNELKRLGAKDIKVQLKKAPGYKGKLEYKIQLNSESEHELKEILSEGELRIVALSGFFAYTTGENHTSPFIFDDPISSLDEKFTERVSKRLVELSKQRQVIVFTHRLTIFNSLKQYAKKYDTKYHLVKINAEDWGTGDPGKYPMEIKETLHKLSNRLIELKKIQNDEGKDRSKESLKSVIADFREALENCVEKVLLSSVIERYNIVIHSSKVKSLAKITDADCRLIDDLMTRYSADLHSSPDEINKELPQVEDVQRDMQELRDWIKGFEKRPLNQDQIEGR